MKLEMEIKKEKQNEMTIHKKKEIKVNKQKDSKINDRHSSVRTNYRRGSNVREAYRLGEEAIANQIEGGEHIQDAMEIARVGVRGSRTVKDTADKLYRIRKKPKLNKRVQKKTQKMIRKKSKKAAKKIAKKTSKKIAKETSKEITKETAKIATEVGATTAGSVGGPYGMIIGYAAGEAVGEAIDKVDYKYTQRMRKLKFFWDKLQPQDKQKDNIFKLAVDTIKNFGLYALRKMIKFLIPALLPILVIVISTGATVMGIIAILYNSPLALFLPPLADGETIHSVTAELVSGFNDEVQALVDKYEGADKGRIVYVDYEGTSTPSNYYDIMCVYMVKYGYENTAAEMSDGNKINLMGVAAEMMQYTTKITEETEGKGKNKKTVKYYDVEVNLKTYSEMAVTYSFTTDQVELLNHMMSQYASASSSTDTGGIGMANLKGSLTNDEIKTITDKITDSKQKKVAEFVLSKVGYPYSQPNRDSGKAFDCSSLAYYAWKAAGVDISNGGSTTAAAEAQGLEKNAVDEKDIKPGDLIFYSYTTNGRYKNISHVAIYVGSGKVVEAVDSAHGVCIGDYHNVSLVMICRPNKK